MLPSREQSSLPPDLSLPPPAPPVATTSAPIQRLKTLLRQTLRVVISDDRIFVGTFVGTDKQLNILLFSAEEYRVGPEAQEMRPLYAHAESRLVGQVMIPWRLVKKVEMQRSPSRAVDGKMDGESDDDTLYT